MLKNLSDTELHARTIAVARKEQEATLLTLAHLREIERRRLHLKLGFGSLFRYAVEALGFSEPAASQRIGAMRLAAAVPEAQTRLESGELKLSSAAAIQRFIRQEEKASERVLTESEKSRLVSVVTGKSYRDAERALLAFAKNPEPHRLRERERAVTPTRTELRFFAGPELMEELKRVRELKGDVALEEIFQQALAVYLDKVDPARGKSKKRQATPTSGCGQGSASSSTPTSPATPANESSARPSRYVPVALVRSLHERSKGRCEYVAPETGRRCESRHRPQMDHQIPFALGGSTTAGNLRHLCPAHLYFSKPKKCTAPLPFPGALTPFLSDSSHSVRRPFV